MDHDRIEALSAEGSDLYDDGDWAGALRCWQRALALVDEPQADHHEAGWLWASIGDACCSGERWAEAEQHLTRSLQAPGTLDNPYIWLRLGQSQYELGRGEAAVDSLLRAYMLEGDDIFTDEAPRYRQLLVDRGLIEETP